jgi:hypothetical protein
MVVESDDLGGCIDAECAAGKYSGWDVMAVASVPTDGGCVLLITNLRIEIA